MEMDIIIGLLFTLMVIGIVAVTSLVEIQKLMGKKLPKPKPKKCTKCNQDIRNK